MRTDFDARQLADPDIAEIDDILRRCIHCGLCNAVCPTYLLEGDERDGPRGRIVMIKDALENNTPASAGFMRHVGGCLSCMSCTTACPSGVDYRRLINRARVVMRETGRQTYRDKAVTWFLSNVAPFPERLRWALRAGPYSRRISRLLRRLQLKEIAAMAELTPRGKPGKAVFAGPGVAATTRQRRARVILLAGCTQQVLRPDINDATIRLLARRGIDVAVAAGAGCCGSMSHGIGDRNAAKAFAKRNIDAWWKLIDREPVDAIIMNTSACGQMVKDYAHLLRNDRDYAPRAEHIVDLARDVIEFIDGFDLGPPRRWSSLKVAYQSACSLHHGQGIVDQPSAQLKAAGFTVVPVPEAAVCCGAAAGYNITHPEAAGKLRGRKAGHIRSVNPDIVAAGSIACMTHLATAVGYPIAHTVELLDWAYGGPVPRGLEKLEPYMTDVPGPPPLELEDYIHA